MGQEKPDLLELERAVDVSLRKEAVDKAIKFLEPRVAGNIKDAKTLFTELYKEIYEFISNKPYQ